MKIMPPVDRTSHIDTSQEVSDWYDAPQVVGHSFHQWWDAASIFPGDVTALAAHVAIAKQVHEVMTRVTSSWYVSK